MTWCVLMMSHVLSLQRRDGGEARICCAAARLFEEGETSAAQRRRWAAAQRKGDAERLLRSSLEVGRKKGGEWQVSWPVAAVPTASWGRAARPDVAHKPAAVSLPRPNRGEHSPRPAPQRRLSTQKGVVGGRRAFGKRRVFDD